MEYFDGDTEATSEQDGWAPQSFVVSDFEGPLDLLLFLIKKNEVNIYDIPIGSITEQYLSYLKMHSRVGLEDLTEFYSLAATLLYIKSRMLLPVEIDLSEEIDDPRRELVERLIEYQKYKKLSELLGGTSNVEDFSLERRKKQATLPFEEEALWEEMEGWDLLKSFSYLMKGLNTERIIDLYEEVTVNEKISLIYEFLEEKVEFLFLDLIFKPNSMLETVCAFLAVLETVKGKRIVILQHRMFGDIIVRRREQKEEEV